MADFDLSQTGAIIQSVITKVVGWIDSKIQTDDIADKAITYGKIAEGGVTSTRLHDSAVTTAKLAGYAVTEAKIANKAVSEDKLADNAVTLSKLSATLQDLIDQLNRWNSGGFETGDLGGNQVVATDDISDGAVTTAKIGAKAVTNTQLGDLSVNTWNIASAAVTLDKIATEVKTFITQRLQGDEKFEYGDPLRYVSFGSTVTDSTRTYDIAKKMQAWLDSLATNSVENLKDKDGNTIPFFMVRANFDGAPIFILNMIRGWSDGCWVQYAIGVETFEGTYNEILLHPVANGKMYYRQSKFVNGVATWTRWMSDTEELDVTWYISNSDQEWEGVWLSDLIAHKCTYTTANEKLPLIYLGDGWFYCDRYLNSKIYRTLFRFGDGTNGVYYKEQTTTYTLAQ